MQTTVFMSAFSTGKRVNIYQAEVPSLVHSIIKLSEHSVMSPGFSVRGADARNSRGQTCLSITFSIRLAIILGTAILPEVDFPLSTPLNSIIK